MLCVSPTDAADACDPQTKRSNRAFVLSDTTPLDYSTLPVTSATLNYSAFTYEAWVSVGSATSSATSSATWDFILWRIRDSNVERVQVGYKNQQFYIEDSNGNAVLSGNHDMSVGTWVHVAVTRQRDNSVSLYVNGYLVNSGTVSDLSTHNISNTGSGVAGGLMDGMAVVMPGGVEVQLDEVRVFAHWRDLATIRAQMSQPLPTSSAGSSTIHATFNARTYNSNPAAAVKASSRLVGPWSTLITATTTSATGAVLLTAPTLTVVSGGGGLVTWHNRDDIGGRAVTGYRLSISIAGGSSCVQRAYYEAPGGVPRGSPVAAGSACKPLWLLFASAQALGQPGSPPSSRMITSRTQIK